MTDQNENKEHSMLGIFNTETQVRESTRGQKASSTIAREAHRRAITKLEELKQSLQSHQNEVGSYDIRLNSATYEIQSFASRSNPFPPGGFPDEELDAFAQRVADGAVAKRLAAELRKDVTIPPSLRGSGRYVTNPADLETLASRDETRVAIELLRRAVKLQEREVQRRSALAVQEINAELKPKRQRVVSAFVEVLKQLSKARREEQGLLDWLSMAEPDLAGGMSFQLFPNHLDAKVVSWLRHEADSGLITEEQMRACGLIPEGEEVVA